jgi:transcriptional regulator with XRE-family HTH domain
MGFGRKLRREREMRSISLEEMSLHTKISTRFLEAIENDRFDMLPGGAFSRSFVLHYAHYLGLDEAQVGAEFDSLLGPPKPVDLRQLAAQRDQRAATAPPGTSVGRAAPNLKRAVATALLSASLLLLGGYAVWERWVPIRVRASWSSVPTTPAPVPQASAIPAVKAVAEAEPDGASRARLRLQIDTLGASWAVAYADGRKIWEEMMTAGETHTVAANFSIKLRVGNAGDVVLTLNGETQPPLGRKGEAKSVAFSARDLKTQ